MADYKPGFQSAHERVTRRDHTGKYGQGKMLARRKVGDVDPVGKAKFEAALQKARRPMGTPAAPRAPAPQAQPETTFRKSSGGLRTRKERIDYEVEKAVTGR